MKTGEPETLEVNATGRSELASAIDIALMLHRIRVQAGRYRVTIERLGPMEPDEDDR